VLDDPVAAADAQRRRRRCKVEAGEYLDILLQQGFVDDVVHLVDGTQVEKVTTASQSKSSNVWI
jgi:hypothetical protein